MANFSNFASNVPSDVQNKIHSLINTMHEEVTMQLYDTYCEQIDSIEGNYVSGWMPNQGGGFVSSCMYNPWSTCKYITEKQRDHYNSIEEDAVRQYKRENDLDDDEDTLAETEQEDMQEYVCEYMLTDMETLIRIDLYAWHGWKDKDENVTLNVSINYNDAPYYREKYAEDVVLKVFSKEEFMQLTEGDIQGLIEEIKGKVKL